MPDSVEVQTSSNDTNQKESQHNSGSESPKLEGDSLKAALLKQLEYYFSKENLDTDTYLRQQMNPESYVPIKTISNFSKVKNLTTDIALVLEVLKGSKEVEVHENGELVRPNIKVQRTTLILRDIGQDVPHEEVEKIFTSIGRTPKTLKADIGNTWFATFHSQEEAIETFETIRNQSFQGKQIQVRCKSETVHKSFYTYPQVQTNPENSSFNPYLPQTNGYYDYNEQYRRRERGENMRGDRENRNDNRENKDRGVNRGPRSSMPRGEHRDQGAPSTNSNLTSNSNVTTRSSSSEFVSPTQSDYSYSDDKSNMRRDDDRRRKQGGQNSGYPRAKPKAQVSLNLESFPPLPGEKSKGQEAPTQSQNHHQAQTQAYGQSLKQYSLVANAVADKPPPQPERPKSDKRPLQKEGSDEKMTPPQKPEGESQKPKEQSRSKSRGNREERHPRDRDEFSERSRRDRHPRDRNREKPKASTAKEDKDVTEDKEKSTQGKQETLKNENHVEKEQEKEPQLSENREESTSSSALESGDSGKSMSYAQILRTNDKIEKKEGQEGKTPVANKGTQTKYDGRSSKPANSYSSFSSPRSKHGKNQSKSKDERPQRRNDAPKNESQKSESNEKIVEKPVEKSSESPIEKTEEKQIETTTEAPKQPESTEPQKIEQSDS